jgi:hypothetical protein
MDVVSVYVSAGAPNRIEQAALSGTSSCKRVKSCTLYEKLPITANNRIPAAWIRLCRSLRPPPLPPAPTRNGAGDGIVSRHVCAGPQKILNDFAK